VVKRVIVMAISIILALAVAAPIASGQPASQRQDLTALTEAWWTWALKDPSPMVGEYEGGQQCEGEFIDGVFFLAGTFEGGDAKRTCTVPADTALFFPVITAFCTVDEPTYPQCATGLVDTGLATEEPYATLDGKNLKFRRITTEEFPLILPFPNIFGLPGGEYEHLALSDGLWVYLPKGLKPGEYTLEFGGAIGDSPLNVTYELIVV
jgi:hypothetical protein